jgi:hypothetical protein
VVFADSSELNPGYLLVAGTQSSTSIKKKLGDGGFSAGSICTATGHPLGERHRARRETLLRQYGLPPLGEVEVVNATTASSNIMCILESGEVSYLVVIIMFTCCGAPCVHLAIVTLASSMWMEGKCCLFNGAGCFY